MESGDWWNLGEDLHVTCDRPPEGEKGQKVTEEGRVKRRRQTGVDPGSLVLEKKSHLEYVMGPVRSRNLSRGVERWMSKGWLKELELSQNSKFAVYYL